MSKKQGGAKFEEWLEPDRLMLLEAWARDYTKTEIAERMGIGISTLYVWEERYEPIKKALSAGAEIVDYRVENALLKSALGYKTKEIKVTIGMQKIGGQTYQITKETTTKEVAPNVTACAMWLNNRRPDKWKKNRDRIEELEKEDSNIQITIVRGSKENESEEDSQINQEIRLERKKPSSDKSIDYNSIEHRAKSIEIKNESIDEDYWPEDWEDEE